MARLRIGRERLRPTIFVVVSMLVILLGGGMTLLWQVQHAQMTRADGGNVIGPPSLPAQTVNQILARMGSPMVGTGAVVEAASRQTNIDDAFALAVWWTETNDGAAGVGLADRNPGSVRGGTGYPVAYDGYTVYPSYSAAIFDWFNLLRNRYVNSGLTSAFTICRPYVGTASSYQWAVKVVNLMLRYHSEAPPTPTPTIAVPTPDLVQMQHKKVHVLPPQPATLGRMREVHMAGGVLPPVTKSNAVAGTAQAAITSTSTASTTPATSPLFIILGLLVSLAIALWGVKIGRGIPSVRTQMPVSDAGIQPVSVFAASTIMPPLYANEFSPVLAPQSLATGQLAWPQMQQTPLPVPAFSDSGLFKRYVDIDTAPQPVILQPVSTRMQVELAQNGYGPVTETLADSYPPVPVMVQRTPELARVGVRPGGLLRRYALEKPEQE